MREHVRCRPSPLWRRGRGGAREGLDRGRVSAHHRSRCLRCRRARPAAPQPRRHHERGPRGRPDRRRRAPGLCSVRQERSARSTALRSRKNSAAQGYRDRAGRPARTASISRSQVSPRSCGTRSPAAPGRSRGRRSGSVLATVVRPSAASCATSRSRTAARRSSTTPRRPRERVEGDREPLRVRSRRGAAAARRRSAPGQPSAGGGSDRGTPDRASRRLRGCATCAQSLLEQTAGELSPHEALQVAREMIRDRRVLTLGGRADDNARGPRPRAGDRTTSSRTRPTRRTGCWAHRADERGARGRRAHRRTTHRRARHGIARPDRSRACGGARRASRDRARAWSSTLPHEPSNWQVGKRSGSPSPAPLPSGSAPTARRSHGQTLTLDALIARANTGSVHVGPDTTVILDEAGMVDHKRLDALTELVERSGAKLIAVGDGKQLPSIGPGGMFDRLTSTRRRSNWRRSTAPRTRTSSERGKHYAPANQSARWRTTRPTDDSTSPTPATRPPRTPSKPGHNSPRKPGYPTKSR